MTRARSTRLSVAGFVAAVAMAATAAIAAPAQAQTGEGLIPPGDWTDEQVAEMLALIDATEEALPANFPVSGSYDDVFAELGPMGFFDFGVPAPGGYYHFINAVWLFDDDVVDPEHPESLVYQTGDDGQLHLVSAMFMLEPGIGPDDIPHDIAWLPGWHGHPELCTRPDGTFAGITDPDDPDCPEGTSQATTPLMMHVWIVDNPCDHRFGGIGVGGLHCDVDHHDDHDDMPDDMPDDHDDMPDDMPDDEPDDEDDDEDGGQPAPPAQPVVAAPTFTG